jgi:hypothetical protein
MAATGGQDDQIAGGERDLVSFVGDLKPGLA